MAAPKTGPAARKFRESMESSMGCRLPLKSMHGATDAHNFAGLRYPVIISGTGGESNDAHGANEHVDIRVIRKFEKGLIDYINDVRDNDDSPAA